MVKSYLNLLVRNRKIHLLVFVVFLLSAAFHTMVRQGVTLDYSTYDPHSSELTYQSISETIHSTLLVTDVRIQRCVRGFSCSAPVNTEPGFWVKVPTKLNLYPTSIHLFNYYLYVEKTKGAEAKRYVVDIQFTSKNEPPSSKVELKWLSHKVGSQSYIWIGYMETLDFEAPLIRDVNVLYGKHDMSDARDHWKFSPTPIQLPFQQSIHPMLSTLIVAVNEELAIFTADQEFDNYLKKNEVFVNVDPGFKIIQISDMHIGQDSALCEAEDGKTGPTGRNCKFDINTLRFLEDVLKNEEDIKLVIFTGDIIDYSRVKHFESAILKALAPVLRAKIPFIFTFGDSDHEWSKPQSKINILNFISSLPRCYNKRPGDLNHRLHGLTNGNLNVYQVPPLGGQETFDYKTMKLDQPSAVITYLDSEEMYVDETQSTYIYRLSQTMKDVNFKLLFFHNPLPNFRPSGRVKLIGGYNEKHRIHTKTSAQFLSDVKDCGYRAVSVGHEHENDNCLWDDKDNKEILLCYSSVAGESANTRIDPNFERRLRVFDIRFDAQEIYSWKRKKGADQKSVSFDSQLIFKVQSPGSSFVEDNQDEKQEEKQEKVKDKKPKLKASDHAPIGDSKAPAKDLNEKVTSNPPKKTVKPSKDVTKGAANKDSADEPTKEVPDEGEKEVEPVKEAVKPKVNKVKAEEDTTPEEPVANAVDEEEAIAEEEKAAAEQEAAVEKEASVDDAVDEPVVDEKAAQ